MRQLLAKAIELRTYIGPDRGGLLAERAHVLERGSQRAGPGDAAVRHLGDEVGGERHAVLHRVDAGSHQVFSAEPGRMSEHARAGGVHLADQRCEHLPGIVRGRSEPVAVGTREIAEHLHPARTGGDLFEGNGHEVVFRHQPTHVGVAASWRRNQAAGPLQPRAVRAFTRHAAPRVAGVSQREHPSPQLSGAVGRDEVVAAVGVRHGVAEVHREVGVRIHESARQHPRAREVGRTGHQLVGQVAIDDPPVARPVTVRKHDAPHVPRSRRRSQVDIHAHRSLLRLRPMQPSQLYGGPRRPDVGVDAYGWGPTRASSATNAGSPRSRSYWGSTARSVILVARSASPRSSHASVCARSPRAS